MRDITIEQIILNKVIAIVRGIEKEKILMVAEALFAGGIRLMEVTFDQKHPKMFSDTTEAIKAVTEAYGDRLLVGAGTVVTPELVDMAATAGAHFIVSPDTNAAVIRQTQKHRLVSIPGAMTPSEILAAHNEGADFIKLFPASFLGIDFIKAMRAPISHVKLLAVGGINENNIHEYLAAGMCGAGIGGNLVNAQWIKNGEYDQISTVARALVAASTGTV